MKRTASARRSTKTTRSATITRESTVSGLLTYLRSRQAAIIGTIRHLVEYESPTDNKRAVDELGRRVADAFQRLGGNPRFHPAEHVGDHLQVDFLPAAQPPRKPVMLLGHLDTVWPLGTLQSMRFRIAKDRLWGPGVLDMKSGIAQMIFAIEALQAVHGRLPRAITVLLTSDEETGSNSSARLTRALSRKCAAVLVLEPAYGLEGALKTARKGVGEYRLTVTGRAAHAGLDFEKGISAIMELARQLQRIAEFTDLSRGITVNPGVIRGGTRANVVAAEAWADIDVRISASSQASDIAARFRALQPFDPECQLKISGGMTRPPMERTDSTDRYIELARGLGREFGLDLGEAAVGGASDGNFTAALGIPTLDGLGAVGEGAHAAGESVLISQLVPRTALLARLIEEL